MSKPIIKSVAFQGDVFTGMKDFVQHRNIEDDKQGHPRTTFNFTVNIACKQYLARENAPRGKGSRR